MGECFIPGAGQPEVKWEMLHPGPHSGQVSGIRANIGYHFDEETKDLGKPSWEG